MANQTFEPTLVATYIIYIALSICLTVWVARTLHKNGRVFLVDVFHGNEALADSVNQLLVVGFYLVNLGYVSLALKIDDPVTAVQVAIEELSTKMGVVMLMLGAMHFLNLIIFNKLRNQAMVSEERNQMLLNRRVEGARG